MYPPAPLWGTRLWLMLSTVTVHSHKPADSVLQSLSTVLYPSFNGSPPDPEQIKKRKIFLESKFPRVIWLHRRKARASEAQKHWKT